jgi:hypothetical protein
MHGYVHHLIDPLHGQHLCQLQDKFLFFPHVLSLLCGFWLSSFISLQATMSNLIHQNFASTSIKTFRCNKLSSILAKTRILKFVKMDYNASIVEQVTALVVLTKFQRGF